MPTPCLNRCRLDAEGAACRDCGRTLDEIAAWGGLDEDRQLAIMATLPARLAAVATRARAAQQQQQQ
jgi:predicted Fe-S protein YdhL (DUF1289 family)